MAGTSIKKNEQKLQNTLANVQKYCPDAVPKLNKVDFIFKNIDGKGGTEKNGEKYSIVLPKDFYKTSPDERLNTICHEVDGHVNFMGQNPNKTNSKAEELFSYNKGETAKEKFLKDRGDFSYKPQSQEEIMKFLNTNPAYRCLPDKPMPESFINNQKIDACGIVKDAGDFIKNFIFMGSVKAKDHK